MVVNSSDGSKSSTVLAVWNVKIPSPKQKRGEVYEKTSPLKFHHQGLETRDFSHE